MPLRCRKKMHENSYNIRNRHLEIHCCPITLFIYCNCFANDYIVFISICLCVLEYFIWAQNAVESFHHSAILSRSLIYAAICMFYGCNCLCSTKMPHNSISIDCNQVEEAEEKNNFYIFVCFKDFYIKRQTS